jgi:hypothetical protein
MEKYQVFIMALFMSLSILCCSNNNGSSSLPAITVNSLDDIAAPPAGTVTLRSALASAASGQPIIFDTSLDGGTIQLSVVGEEHSILKGEVMEMIEEPSGPVTSLKGYFDRDYGRSALYAQKDVVLDAVALPSGITLSWAGGTENPARVLAVYGNLTLNNVSITGGNSVAADISADNEDQPWTLARGGALAVWGIARLTNCRLYNNSCEGDFESSRDRGAFGGGIYANIIYMEECIVSGNSVVGGGAAGGGVFSVGGYGVPETVSTIECSSITGNHISGLMTYGGGVYSDGGSIGNRKTIQLSNCTIARNLVDYPAFLPSFLLGMGYWRGGGIYVSNGYLAIHSCTVVENEVYGVARTDDLGKPNMAGGIAATIGNAHALEDMTIGHSVVAGNTVHETGGSTYEHDIFTGSVFYFKSMGYNRIGVLDFSQILVPVGEEDWASLCRKHYPKLGDQDGVALTDVLNLTDGITYSDLILSAGVDASDPVALYYEPDGDAVDQVPSSYYVDDVYGEYAISDSSTDNFLSIMLSRLEGHYGLNDFAASFTADFEGFLQMVDSDDETDGNQPYKDPEGNPILTLAETQFFGPAQTWPKELPNYPYIHFWHRLDYALRSEDIPGMGTELLGDEAWLALFTSGSLEENHDITMAVWTSLRSIVMEDVDQLGTERAENAPGDIGAIEIP